MPYTNQVLDVMSETGAGHDSITRPSRSTSAQMTILAPLRENMCCGPSSLLRRDGTPPALVSRYLK